MAVWCDVEGSKERGIEATAWGRHLPHARQWFGHPSSSGPKEGSNHLWGARIPQREVNKDVHRLLDAQQGYPDRSPLSLPPSLVICLKWLPNHSFFHYLDIYSGYQHSPIHEDNRVKLPSPVPTAHFAYWRMSFGLCNAPALPQRCMMVAFSDPIENIMKDFSVCGNTLRC